MNIRPICSDDAAEAAELVRLVRERPEDRIDPFPPAQEGEVLADAGARGKDPARHPLVVVEGQGSGEHLVGYGAHDCSADLPACRLVGPVVHPAHRRRGYGTKLLEGLLVQARTSRRKRVRVLIGSQNGAAKALLRSARFKQRETYTCLRLARPARYPELALPGISVRRVDYDEAGELTEFTSRLVPRQDKQVRSLLKSDDYIVVLAYRKKKPVGFAELDMRYGTVATVEQLDGSPALIRKGLGNLLLAELMPFAFGNGRIRHMELLVTGTEHDRLATYTQAGFEIRDQLLGFARKL